MRASAPAGASPPLDAGPAGSIYGSIVALLRVVGDGTGSTNRRLVLRFLGAAVGDTVMLFAINDTLRAYQEGETFPLQQFFLFAVSFVVSIVLLYGLQRDISTDYQQAALKLRVRMVSKLARIDLAALERIGGPRLQMALTVDTERLLRASSPLVDVLSSLGLCALAIPYLMLSSTKAAVCTLGALGILTAMTARKGNQMARGLAAAESLKVPLVESCLNLVRGFKQFKQHAGKRAALLADVRTRGDDYAAARHATYQRYTSDDAIGFVVFFALQAGVAFLVPLLFPEQRAEVGPLLMSIWYISSSTTAVFKRQAELIEAAGALGRLDDLEGTLDVVLTQPRQPSGPEQEREQELVPFALPLPFQELKIEGLQYRHESRPGTLRSDFALGPIDVTIGPGEIIFITGDNGSGKSTFLKLLLGLYVPTAGVLHCNGQRVPPLAPRQYLDLFGVILSNFVIFDRLYGMENIDPQRVEQLLAQMELDDQVSLVDGRFSRVDLSTGQRKRLAMIVALLLDRPIYVFDEWAADQDPEFRGVFYRQLLPELRRKGKTVIAVTHDDHYFSVADRRLHFRDGRLVAP